MGRQNGLNCMADDSCGTTTKPGRKRKVTEITELHNRSRISNGQDLLPHVHAQSVWARTCRDSYAEILSDRGGADAVPFTVRSTAKHTAVLSVELDFLASKIGKIREEGGEPQPHLHDLYTRLLNAERRQCEALGWDRVAKDVTPSISTYSRGGSAEDVEEG